MSPGNLSPSSDSKAPLVFDLLKRSHDGLVPTIVQDADTHQILMFAWMNDEALRATLTTGQAHFFSRSRNALWHKGATSGHTQTVVEVRLDCDADVLLVRVRQLGGACHMGYRSCFFRTVAADGRVEIADLPVFQPETVYRPTKNFPPQPDSPPKARPET